MVLRQYNNAKVLGGITAFVIVVIIMSIIFVPIFELASSGHNFGFPTSSDISSASGINVNFTEQGAPKSTNGSGISHNSGVVSGQYVYYNSTSDGYFELTEVKTSNSTNSSGLYSSFYDHFKSDYRNDTSAYSISSNQSALGFTYFYFSSSGFVHFKASIGYNGIYLFFLLYAGSAAVDINNTAAAVILMM